VERVKENSQVTEFLGTIQLDYDPKPHSGGRLRFMPLTGLQAARTDRFVHRKIRQDFLHLLSPRQS
jgi:hypothetical protein